MLTDNEVEYIHRQYRDSIKSLGERADVTINSEISLCGNVQEQIEQIAPIANIMGN